MTRKRTPHQQSFQRLYEIAEAQQGYFTTKQAKAAGFDERNHPYHVKAGNWTRERRGLYRLTRFPAADRPDLVVASLWSMNRNGEIQGCFSHETALTLYELSDAMPSKLHMTVPPGFRRMAPAP
ncbi:MAG: type IV toxin-antitoxin system AbiEi family antitoxin domain-containing protein, partial [Elusimicrobiota bacterium]